MRGSIECGGDTGDLIASERVTLAKEASLAELIFKPIDTDIELKKQSATKIPFDQMTALGAAFSALSPAFRTITQNIEIPANNLVEVLNRNGEPVDLSTLMRFAEQRQYMMGSRFDQDAGFEQMRLSQAVSHSGELVTRIPVDPTALFVAAALIEINKKLDAIQETQQEMFEYLKNRDKAEQRANLEALSDIMNNYRFHWDNETYRQNKHILVQGIRKDADQSIIHHRAQIKSKIDSKGLFHFNGDVDRVSRNTVDELKEYRLAVYLYSYSSFLEVMLLGNYDKEYLERIVNCIEDRDVRYRELYTQCYDYIDRMSRESVEQHVSGALAFAGKALGGFLSNTPIGDLTPIDNALSGAGHFLEETKNATASQRAERNLAMIA